MSTEVRVNPTLVVGVGGTGCHVVKMLRKMIEQDVDPEDRDRIPMRFLGVDTDLADAKSQQPEESPLDFVMPISGRAAALGGKDDPTRAGSSFRKWLPRTKAGEYVLNPEHLAKGEGAGGKRLLGRYGFKYFAPSLFDAAEQHVEALRDLCNNPVLRWRGLEYVASDRLEVFVVCSLAGGTGSGAFLDVVAMCHRLCDQAAPGLERGIHLVLVTPSAFQHVVHRQNKPIHKGTAFACLKDLDNLMGDPGPKTFEFHGDQDVTIRGRFADDVFLIGRHGATGTVSDLGELFRILAIQLYGMIGSPMGAAFDTINNNNTTLDGIDSGGGRKRYSAFGLVGLDYDLETRRYRAESAAGHAAARRLREGSEGVPGEEAAEAEARNLVKPYLNGAAAPKVTELLGTRAADLALPTIADEEKPRDVAGRIKTLAGSQSEAALTGAMRAEAERKWNGDPKAKGTGWRAEFEAAAFDLVARFGTAGARAILTKAEGLLREARAALEERRAATTIAAAAADATARLERIGGFYRLTHAERANVDKMAAIEAYETGMKAHLREIACGAVMETAFGPKGLPATLARIADEVRSADDLAHRAEEALERRRAQGVSPFATAMDRARVVYDVIEDFGEADPDSLARRGAECVRTWLAGAPGTGAADPGRRAVEALVAYYKPGGKRAPADVLADALSREAGALVKDEISQHILDVIMPGGRTDELPRNLGRALGNLTPLALVDQLNPDESPYDTTLALVPATENGAHPLQGAFDEAFRQYCAEGRHNQAGTAVFGGRPNRLLIAKWILGFALNDRAYPPLAEMRQNYVAGKTRNDFLDVDARWMDQPGPGQSVEGGRRLLWALGLAYGLIAQDKGSRYYGNLRTFQDHKRPEAKGTPEEHEIDVELILKAVGSNRPVKEWLPGLLQGAASQSLGKKDVPLAFVGGSLPKVERKKRDLIGTGRAEAMNGFLNDVAEDHMDLQIGLTHVLNAYVESRGKGEAIGELEAYRDRLEAVRTPDEAMGAQLEGEVSMLNLALDNLRDKGEFGLPAADPF